MMEVKEVINLFRKTEGYIGLNAEYVNEIADALEKVESEQENLIDYNADLNNRLNKAESHIEKLEKQLAEKQPEWISVEEKMPELGANVLGVSKKTGKVGSYIFFNHGIIKENISHWMFFPKPPKPKEPTFKDVFLKAFPKAVYHDVSCCAIFPEQFVHDSCDNNCDACWNLPYFEEEEGERNA